MVQKQVPLQLWCYTIESYCDLSNMTIPYFSETKEELDMRLYSEIPRTSVSMWNLSYMNTVCTGIHPRVFLIRGSTLIDGSKSHK